MILTGEKRSTGGENLFQSHLVHHKSHMDCPEFGTDPTLCGDMPTTILVASTVPNRVCIIVCNLGIRESYRNLGSF
jgi:hypothetical protein